MSSSESEKSFLLFFSNYCNYSKEVIGIITRKNIRNTFVLICIDTIQNIPPFVDRVPMIINKQSKGIYVDEDIVKLLDAVSQQMYPPVSIGALNSAWDDTEFENPGGENEENFCQLDLEQFRIHCANDDDTNKVKKADSSILEQYIAQRDADIKIYDRPMMR
jgi:hypothetical protein